MTSDFQTGITHTAETLYEEYSTTLDNALGVAMKHFGRENLTDKSVGKMRVTISFELPLENPVFATVDHLPSGTPLFTSIHSYDCPYTGVSAHTEHLCPWPPNDPSI